MHTQTIFELSQEAERLLQLALQNLDTLKSMPTAMLESTAAAITGEKNNVLPLHFSARGVEAQQAMLNNELRKITRLEMVLAIVGTMKAGKSTTINAIVGTEVLPNQSSDDGAPYPDSPHAGPEGAGAAFLTCLTY